MVNVAIFADNYIGFQFLKLLEKEGVSGITVYTYHPNYKRSKIKFEFSIFNKTFNLIYLSANKFPEAKKRIKPFDIAFCIDWTKDFFKDFEEKSRVLYTHPSLLPFYRGYGVITEQFYRGVVKSGITVYTPADKIDGGDIVFQNEIIIEHDDYPLDFIEKYTKKTAQFFDKLIKNEIHTTTAVKQNENLAFYIVRKREKDALIDFNKSALSVYNHVRAFSKPYFGAHFYFNDRKIKLWKAKIEKWDGNFGKAGEIIDKSKYGTEIACGQGTIIANEIEIENKTFLMENILLENKTLLNKL